MKPLDGVLIADFSRVLAGPYATMLLADLGAQVVKVERPGIGDDTRAWGPPFADSTATYFLGVNRNKQSVALDFTTAEDAALARELVRRADVVVENFLPGTMDRHGLGYEQVRELNPGVVYCSITGFGADEGAGLPGYDLIVQAVGGLMSVTGETGREVGRRSASRSSTSSPACTRRSASWPRCGTASRAVRDSGSRSRC